MDRENAGNISCLPDNVPHLEDEGAQLSLLEVAIVLLLGPERDELVDVIDVDVDSPALTKKMPL